MQTIFKNRISKVLSKLKKLDQPCALVLSSAARASQSRDSHYPFYQDRDFYYLTGIELPEIIIFMSGKSGKAILIAAPENPVTAIWEGVRPNLKKIASSLGAELIITENISHEIGLRMIGHEVLFFGNQPESPAWKIAQRFIELPSHARTNLPRVFKHSDVLIEPLRLIKDKHEIELIKQAADISFKALNETRALISSGTRECDLAAALVYMFKLMDGQEAFTTIAACGRSAATLHYNMLNRTLKNGELLLLDFGASYHNYASDITRVFPVRGYFEGWQIELYEIVLSAQKAALKKIKPGILVKQVYDAAARELTIGLKALGILKGKTSALLSKQAFRPYFPHGIGHTLGLDVHDIGNFRGNNQATIVAGMVFTIEPGLYFPKPIKGLSSCGIRIEDNVLVTRSGHQCLTSQFPKEVMEIEKFLAS